MKVGASYYPETLPRDQWAKDLATGREIGLSALRCGEFAWSAFSPQPGQWQPKWAIEFLDEAHAQGYDVIWCTPSATPPPYLVEKWPDMLAVNIDGRKMQPGIRRHYCPSHEGYLDLCEQTAEKLARDLAAHPAVTGWQVDNEIAGDGFTCWCERCQGKFQQWLQATYGTLDRFNQAHQTSVWSQSYTAWGQVPIPWKFMGGHTPALKLDFRRFRAANWLNFYRRQYDALHRGGAKGVTTNFYNIQWDMPFDQWAWRPSMDAIGASHYLEEKNESRFQLALLQGAQPDSKPLWVLEQKAGQQNSQNYYPEDLSRIERHLRICAQSGAHYAIYWHLRQHSAGCEMEHGAVLRHDGVPTRIARAIAKAIPQTAALPHAVPPADNLLVFSFQQQWANESRPQPGTRWDYRTEVQEQWYSGARKALGDIRVGSPADISPAHSLVLAPFLQLIEPDLLERLGSCLTAGATVITTADAARLDWNNNVLRQAPLAGLGQWFKVPAIEMLHLKEGFVVKGKLAGASLRGGRFWAVPTGTRGPKGLGELKTKDFHGPAALSYRVGKGRLVIVMTAPDAASVAAIIKAM